MCKLNTELIDHLIPIMVPSESNNAVDVGPLYGEWADAQIETARQNVSYILINSKNFVHSESALKMMTDEKNIKFSLDKHGRKPVFKIEYPLRFRS